MHLIDIFSLKLPDWKIKKIVVSRSVDLFANILSDVGLDLFAHKESKMKNPNPIQPFLKLHNKIKELRIEKRDCKKLFKSTTDGQVLQNIRDKRCSLVRLHSRLSKKLKSKIFMKEKHLTEKNFRKNPFAFAQKIPFDPVDGNPDTSPSFNRLFF